MDTEMAGTTRALPASNVVSSASAFAVGVSSLMDLTGRTVTGYFRQLRSEDVPTPQALALMRSVKHGQWVGFALSMLLLATACVLIFAGHMYAAVAVVLLKTTSLVGVNIYMSHLLRARQP